MNVNHGTRTIYLECLRENASNMRREHEDLSDRISCALEKSRASIVSIENMNIELRKMKETVHNALNNISRNGSDETYEINKACRELMTTLVDTVADHDLDTPFDSETYSNIFSELAKPDAGPDADCIAEHIVDSNGSVSSSIISNENAAQDSIS